MYEAEQAAISDVLTRLKSAEERGIERGIEKGKEEDAINFLKLGVSEEIVANGTGLALEKVMELKKKYIN